MPTRNMEVPLSSGDISIAFFFNATEGSATETLVAELELLPSEAEHDAAMGFRKRVRDIMGIEEVLVISRRLEKLEATT